MVTKRKFSKPTSSQPSSDSDSASSFEMMSPGSNNGCNEDDTESEMSDIGADDREAIDDAANILAPSPHVLAPSTPTGRGVDNNGLDNLASALSSVSVSLKRDDDNVAGQEILIEPTKRDKRDDDDDDDDVSDDDRKMSPRGKGDSYDSGVDNDDDSDDEDSDDDSVDEDSSDDEDFVPNEAKKKAAKERYSNDLETGNPNGAVALTQKMKAEHGNYAKRTQDILNGVKDKSREYSLEYLPLPNEGFGVSGTRVQLDAFGKDASKPGAKKPKNSSWFGKAKHELTRKAKNGRGELCVYFETYEETDNIPAGRRANKSYPNPLPKSRKNDVWTFYFYHPGFNKDYDCLKQVSWMAASDSESSDSD